MNIIEPITSKEPAFKGVTGSWFEIETIDEAMRAQHVSQTAVGIYFERVQNQEMEAMPGTRWFVLSPEGGDEIIGLLAAQPAEGFNGEVFPYQSHLTGHANECPSPSLLLEAEIFAEELDLAFASNHMGGSMPEPESDDDLSM